MMEIVCSVLALLISAGALAACRACRQEVRQSRESFESLLVSQRTEWTEELASLSLRQSEAALGEVGRPGRTQVMRMFHSGIAPDTVAAKLGLPKREVRLAARVFAILAAK